MLSMSRFFSEIHGVDVSDEMLALARQNLRDVPHAHLHRNSGSDLAGFPPAHFDFVYSYAVFQHIPSVEVISRYLEESTRVLKAGGVLCCQLRGGELRPEDHAKKDPTWVGCVYPYHLVFEICRKSGLHLLQISDIDMQHMWVIGRAPMQAAAREHDSQPVLKAVTSTDNPLGIISRTGPGSAFACWLEGFPESLSLEAVSFSVDDLAAVPSYISEHLGRGGFQLNVLVPREARLGEAVVSMRFRGDVVPSQHCIRIEDYPCPEPQLVKVTDGIDLLADSVTASGSLKVLLHGVADPSAALFVLGSVPIRDVSYYCYFSHAFGYEFTLGLPPQIGLGTYALTIRLPGWERVVPVTVIGD